MSSSILQQIQQVLKKSGTERDSSYEPGRLISKTVDVLASEPEKVRTLLEDFQAEDGWVQLTSKNLVYPSDHQLPEGVVLSAELVKGNTSLHVRQSKDGWRVTNIELADAEQDDELIEHVSYLAREPFQALRYQVAWRLTQAEGEYFKVLAPYASRLAGREGR